MYSPPLESPISARVVCRPDLPGRSHLSTRIVAINVAKLWNIPLGGAVCVHIVWLADYSNLSVRIGVQGLLRVHTPCTGVSKCRFSISDWRAALL